jgi:large subunit ribosomal protein MRP49
MGDIRKFWRQYLPRLKYHNPAVAVTVNRTQIQEGPAVMTVHFTDPDSASQTPSPVSSTTIAHTSAAPVAETTPAAPTQRTVTIEMKHRHESEILSQLLSVTKAVPVEATPEELAQLNELDEQRQLSEKDAQRSRAVNEKRKRTEAMLAQARGEVIVGQNS